MLKNEDPTCVACGAPAEYSVTAPEPFASPKGAWFACEAHIPTMAATGTYREYRDAVRPM
jgi:hypothetical protein